MKKQIGPSSLAIASLPRERMSLENARYRIWDEQRQLFPDEYGIAENGSSAFAGEPGSLSNARRHLT